MAEVIAPTKSVMLGLKRSLKIAKEGYDLLDRKRNVLIRELMGNVSKVRELEKTYHETINKAFASLKTAEWLVGRNRLKYLSLTPVERKEVKILIKSVMGVSVAVVNSEKSEVKRAPYSPFGVDVAVDEAGLLFGKACDIAMEMAALETTVIRLATEIKRTQKRANALNNIVIPKSEQSFKFILESLEEKEREEFFKVKLVKKKKG